MRGWSSTDNSGGCRGGNPRRLRCAGGVSRFTRGLVAGLLFGITNVVCGAEPAIDYERQIRPVLKERCLACHGALKQKGGLRLDTAALAIRGGDSGAAIVPTDAAASLLLERITAADAAERMPPEGEPLTPEQIATFQAWVAQGAQAPANEQPERDPRDHWAFRPPARPAIPADVATGAGHERWSLNPIDAFLAVEHRARGLTPRPPADRRVWLRRVSLDLIGLPPTVEDMEAFVADQSPEAYEQVVTRLLDSPHYGERWGRHWMDLWRYSDWWGLGAEVRNSQKHIWHWRDWIIESLNDDKSYAQMLVEMLAADELYPNDLDRLRATGYLARQYFIFNRTAWLDETIEHTAKAMLGLTFNCAKCHDHKYDPLTHEEYYQLRALFEPYQIRTEMLPGQTDWEQDGIPRVFDAHLDVPTHLHVRGDDRQPDTSRTMKPAVPAFLLSDTLPFSIEPVSLPIEATFPGLRGYVLPAYRQAAEKQIAAARSAVDAARKALADNGQPDQAASLQLKIDLSEKSLQAALQELVALELRATADRARIQAGGSGAALSDGIVSAEGEGPQKLAAAAFQAERQVALLRAEEQLLLAEQAALQAPVEKKEEAAKKVAEAKTALQTARAALGTPGDAYTPVTGAKKTQEDYQNRNAGVPFPRTSTGRRSALARWLTDPRHPLPARVAVNHIWMRHMGRPLVPTVFDFGRKGTPPTHPELLDWLAVELIENGWSMKHLHRLIVTSQAYRLSSSNADVDPDTWKADPENRYYWRMNPQRMEAQVVRDSLLWLAGELNPALGGPSLPITDEASRRRSLYFVHSHNDHHQFLSTFDDASVLDCYRRAESIVPQQALALENSPLVTEMAAKIAARVAAARPQTSDAEFSRYAFVAILSVEPAADELAAMLDLLGQMTELAKSNQRPNPEAFARTRLIQSLLNHNDLMTIR
ncbi:MAG: DUF1553 domain-containing protein [Planctomycetales bacterium]